MYPSKIYDLYDKVHFRRATNSDSSQIHLLVRRILNEFGFDYKANSSERDLNNIEETYINNGGDFIVIESDTGIILGTSAILKIDEEECRLRKMYIDSEHRGFGLGKVLLIKCLLRAKQLGFKKIELETSVKMEAAIKLYKKYGFIETRTSNCDSQRCDIKMYKVL